MARRNRRGFGSLRKLPSGRWQASYVAPNGERRVAPMTFTAWVDADVYLSTVRYEIEKNIWVDASLEAEETGGTKFLHFALRHIDLQTTHLGEALKPSTKEHYKKLLGNQLKTFSNRTLDSITKPEIDEWFATHLATGKKTTTSKAYKLLSAVMTRAVLDGLITKNPCAIRGAQQATTGKKVSCPTPGEVDSAYFCCHCAN